MDSECPEAVAMIESGIRDGLHRGGQLYVSLRGRVLADVGIGQARPGVAMTRDSLTLWMSGVKPVAAVAIALLWERQRLDLDDPIARHIPEFGANGKGAVTIRHVLTHTGGFRAVPGAGNESPDDWDTILARINAARLEPRWTPGEKAGYHLATGWFVLGELVRRIDGRAYDVFVREEIFRPLGMNDSWLAIPRDRVAGYGDRIGVTEDTSDGPPRDDAKPPDSVTLSRVRPGASGRGPIRELGRFYECLLNRGETLLRPQTVEALVARHRVGLLDHSFGAVIDWGLGFILNSNHYGKPDWPYNFGRQVSPRTFGHGGRQSTSAFCDPESGLVVAWTCNGMPGEIRHQARADGIQEAIERDVANVETRMTKPE